MSLQEPAAVPGPGEAREATASSSADIHAARLARIKRSVIARYATRKSPHAHLLDKAFADAEFHHRDQWRKSGEPYILHPARVALLAAEAGCDEETVIIALLHDLIEDTEVTKEQMGEQYGEWLAEVVDGLTKAVTKPEQRPRGPLAVETYRKLITSTIKDLRTVQVKVFDRLDNMRDLGYLSRSAQRRIATETMNVYVPMSQRLGMQDIADELTALSFRYLYPRRFTATLEQLKARIREEQVRVTSIKTLLENVVGVDAESGRSVEPLYRQVSDHVHEQGPVKRALAGFKVRVPTAEDCYRALGALHMTNRVVPNSIKDYISNPKPNRYQALHSEIFIGGEPVAICLVSHAMEAVNAKGILAGWEGSQEDLSRYYESYLDLIDHYSGNNDDLRMEDVLRHAQLETLQMFTPKGALLSFPQGATVLDFAFAIHSDLGLHCDGGHMAGRRVSRFEELQDGEVVSVTTGEAVAPTPAWLDHVRTTRAKLSIRRFLNAQANARAQEVGRKLVEAELGRLGYRANAVLEGRHLAAALEPRNLTVAQFLQQVGKGRIALRRWLLDNGLVTEEDVKRADSPGHSLLNRFIRRKQRSPDPVVTVQDLEDGYIRMGECCAPLVGDAIVGVLDAESITIHRTTCREPEAARPQALINVGWDERQPKRAYRLYVHVTQDRPGMLYKVSKVMRDAKVNIDDIALHRDPRGTDAEIEVRVEAIDFRTFRTIVSRLRDIKEVRRILTHSTRLPAAPSPTGTD